MEAGYSCFAELGGEIGELGEIGEPACQQLGGLNDARAVFGDMVSTVSTTHSRSRELILDSLFGSKLST